MSSFDSNAHPRGRDGRFASKSPAAEGEVDLLANLLESIKRAKQSQRDREKETSIGAPLTGYHADDEDRPPVDIEVETARKRWLESGARARPRYVNERPPGQFYSQADFRSEMASVHERNAPVDEAERHYRDLDRRWKEAGSPTMPSSWEVCDDCGGVADSIEGCLTCYEG